MMYVIFEKSDPKYRNMSEQIRRKVRNEEYYSTCMGYEVCLF